MPSFREARQGQPMLERKDSPIVGGEIDSGHPAVALLYNEAQGYICSGTIIDTNVYLTAAHCVPDANAGNYYVVGGTDLINDNPEWAVEAASVHAHPNYDPNDVGFDVGIVITKQTPPVTPLRWQKDVDDSVYAVGSVFTAVGYGVTSGGGGGDGIKRKVSLEIAEIYQEAYGYGGNGKNTCSGDSGGPAIKVIDGQETVIGTVSFGDANCSQTGYDMRTDYHADFIAQYATGNGGGGGGGGGGGTPTPTPTPDPGGNGGDPGDNKGDDGPLGDVGCSVASVATTGSPALLLGLFGLVALAIRRRR